MAPAQPLLQSRSQRAGSLTEEPQKLLLHKHSQRGSSGTGGNEDNSTTGSSDAGAKWNARPGPEPVIQANPLRLAEPTGCAQ